MTVKMFFVGDQEDRYPVLALHDETGADMHYIPETVDEDNLYNSFLKYGVLDADYALIVTDGENPGVPIVRRVLDDFGVQQRTYSRPGFSIDRHMEEGKTNYLFIDAKTKDAIGIARKLFSYGEKFEL